MEAEVTRLPEEHVDDDVVIYGKIRVHLKRRFDAVPVFGSDGVSQVLTSIVTAREIEIRV